MVAKPWEINRTEPKSLNLAKIHMVAKRHCNSQRCQESLNLAKIHMVAKPVLFTAFSILRLNLAKIHMVAKPQTDFIT